MSSPWHAAIDRSLRRDSLRVQRESDMSTLLLFTRNFAFLAFLLSTIPANASGIVDAGFVAEAVKRGVIV
jgi:hypothetical protein